MAAPVVAEDAMQDESNMELLASPAPAGRPASKDRHLKRAKGLVCAAAVAFALLNMWRMSGEMARRSLAQPVAAIVEDAVLPAAAAVEELIGKTAWIRLAEDEALQRCLTADSNEPDPGSGAFLEECGVESRRRGMNQSFRLTEGGQVQWSTLPELCVDMEDSKVTLQQCSRGPTTHFLLTGQGSHRSLVSSLDLSKCIVGLGSRLAVGNCKQLGVKKHFQIVKRQEATVAAVHYTDDAESDSAESASSWLDALGGVLKSVISTPRDLLQSTTPFPAIQS